MQENRKLSLLKRANLHIRTIAYHTLTFVFVCVTLIYFPLKDKIKWLENLKTGASKGSNHIITHNHTSFLDS